ncbi:MAG: hypothetical protein IPH48_07155 [bacterium]|nr:hypothetical protein [bacterium]
MPVSPRPLVFVITGLSTGGAETMLLKLLERLPGRFAPSVVSLTTEGDRPAHCRPRHSRQASA